MTTINVNVVDFSEFPGPRYEQHGPNSGERFRREVLLEAISKKPEKIIVNLDGVLGYGSSFLEEAFGGLIRDGVQSEVALEIANNLISEIDPSLKIEITEYIKEAIEHRNKNARNS
ncbi:DUF4325 domain-containing protein [Pseudomonas chengduensis]|jgi:hypothetical protein|uniref:DUF4325 domain-containing protein n=1 Tax=Pseudomonas sihuiensis TaxID=1274359 RepID=A0A1H2LQK9_9PSED|tara:strand:+ start:282 stop:629 length:348 start_codon:yes stop_codon:yes gene_type:complete